MKNLLLIISLLFAGRAAAQADWISVPDSLLSGADQVVLADDTEFTIESREKCVFRRKYKTLVLHPQGLEENGIELFYGGFSRIQKASVSVRDASGKELKRFSLGDFEDWKGGWEEVASDRRVKILTLPQFTLPITIEAEYAIEYEGSMFFPVWTPVASEKQSLVEATFSLVNRSDDTVRYLGFNLKDPEISSGEKGTEYRWSVARFRAIGEEPYPADMERYGPILFTAPSFFEMDGYAGNMGSWDAFGDWINQLNSGKNDLTEAQIAEIKELTDPLPETREKVRAVYQYLQKNMRYVNISLGIGGWQPFAASYVHEKKYGDCKALTFYAKSMLDALDIPSYYTLVRTGLWGKNLIKEDFPCPFFSHAFLTVPLGNDTIWLECTSQTTPFGYLGTFTSDRQALLIGPSGGQLVHTKIYRMEDNFRKTLGEVQFSENGEASVRLDRTLSGLEIERDGFFFILQATSREQENWMHDHAKNGFQEITGWRLKPLSDEAVPTTGFVVEGKLVKMSAGSSDRIFVQAGDFTGTDLPDLPETGRRSPVEIRYSFFQTDSLSLVFPPGFKPESMPKPVSLQTPFGAYRIRMETSGDQSCLFLREFSLHQGVYPVEDYPAFREFIREVRKQDKQRMVWRKG